MNGPFTHRLSSTRRQLLSGSAGMAFGLTANIRPYRSFAQETQGGTPEPVSGGALRAALLGGGPQDTVHPMNVATPLSYTRTVNSYDTLIEINQGELRYVLAESMEPNEDGSAWTIKLRPGVTFHDGASFGATDVLYTFSTYQQSPLAAQFPALSLIDVAASSLIDDLTLEVVLAQPFGNFPASLWFTPMVADGAIDLETTANGTGPFRLETFAPGDRAVYRRFDDYWGDIAPLDSLELIDIPDEGARFNALLAGQIDLAAAINAVQAQSIEGADDVKIIHLDGVIQHEVGVTMNVTVPPFDNPDVRKALHLLLDRELVLDNAALGYGAVANDLYAVGALYYNDTLPQQAFDLEAAKALIDAAGVAGTELEIYTSPYEVGYVEVATLVAGMLTDAGLPTSLNVASVDVYFTDFATLVAAPLKVSSSGLPSVIDVLEYTYMTGGAFNMAGYSNPEFDRLMGLALETTDEAVRKDYAFQLQEILWQDSPDLVPITFDVMHAAVPSIYQVEGTMNAKYPSFKRAFVVQS